MTTPKKMLFEEFKKEFNKADEIIANYVYLLYMRETEKTDTQKEEVVSVGDILVEKAENATPQAVLHNRLFILQNTEGKFGNIMCINKNTKDPIEYIFNMLTNEIKRTEKFAENETEQGKIVLNQAIQNICNLSIYEIKPELDINTKEPIFTFNKITEYKGA